jgi:hypothetical protein
MRGRRHGESLFDWGIVPGLWFRQVALGRETDEFARLTSASGESLQRAFQTPVVVNNSG